MKTYEKTQDLGPVVIPPWLETSVAHANYCHTNFPPAMIGYLVKYSGHCAQSAWHKDTFDGLWEWQV